MSVVQLVPEPEHGDGDGDEPEQLTCPECGSVGFYVWEDLSGLCMLCETKVDFNADSTDTSERT